MVLWKGGAELRDILRGILKGMLRGNCTWLRGVRGVLCNQWRGAIILALRGRGHGILGMWVLCRGVELVLWSSNSVLRSVLGSKLILRCRCDLILGSGKGILWNGILGGFCHLVGRDGGGISIGNLFWLEKLFDSPSLSWDRILRGYPLGLNASWGTGRGVGSAHYRERN